MSIVYSADVFCDGECAGLWTHGATGSAAPTKTEARANAAHSGYVHHKGKDYCPACWKALAAKQNEPEEAHQ
jgi:hypothetical protein